MAGRVVGNDDVMRRFNDAINVRDVERLVGMMTSDHAFIDASGTAVRGRDEVAAAWRGFFAAYPEYRNNFDRVVATGDGAVAVGTSTCPKDPDLDGPALWRATIRDGNVAHWRVYDDTPGNRAQLGLR